jgi:hypothetical protein
MPLFVTYPPTTQLMPQFVTYPPTTQLKIVATRVAALAKADNRRKFRDQISNDILSLQKRDRRSTTTQPGGLLVEAADKARQLDKDFSEMNQTDREWVEYIKQVDGVVFAAGEIQDLGTTITNISMLLDAALGRPPASRPGAVLRGPAHVARDQGLREIVFALFAAAKETGGHFTVNKNSAGGGTLALALLRLRNHLPKDLVRQPLPLSTLQRLKTEFDKLHV